MACAGTKREQPRMSGQTAQADARGSLSSRLQQALGHSAPTLADAPLEPLPDTGLAHDHVRLVGRGLLARIPKQSQMGLPAEENLRYQAACFERASASGHMPRLHAVLSPSDDLPRGGLIVEEIVGRIARLPGDLPAIARALAALHKLPLPEPGRRAPLRDADDPLQDLIEEVAAQAAHLAQAGLSRRSRTGIDAELARLADTGKRGDRPPKTLISFDAHPGNFIVTPDGKAVLVDLEKARYGFPPLDLAHATLYTSTTWDVATYAELTPADVAGFYGEWTSAMGPGAEAWQPWFVALRRGMWLWSVTWCAKWRVLSGHATKADTLGEDWSANKSDRALIEHVRDRVECYLSPAIVQQVQAEFVALEALLASGGYSGNRNRI